MHGIQSCGSQAGFCAERHMHVVNMQATEVGLGPVDLFLTTVTHTDELMNVTAVYVKFLYDHLITMTMSYP